jgi:hypothetical protein
MFLGPDVRAVLRSSRYIPQPSTYVMFLSHQHMFLGFWPRNMYLFPVVWEDFNVVKSRFPSSAAWRPVATQAGGIVIPSVSGTTRGGTSSSGL